MRRPRVFVPLALILGCARVVAPGGGPEDREPPEFLESVPGAGLTDTLPRRITLVFDEPVQPQSSTPVFFPDPGHSLRYRGNRIEAVLERPPEGRTLTMLLPPGLADRRGNPTGYPLNLTWTTADTSLTGSAEFILSMQGGGSVSTSALIRLFHLPDSLNPVRGGFPDSTGWSEMPWLDPGDYRVLAFEDRDGSRTWEDQTEPGVIRDFRLEAGETARIELVLAVVDTVGPRIVSVEALDGYHVLVEWNEELSRQPPSPELLDLFRPDGTPVEVLGTSLTPGRARGGLLLHTVRMPDTLLTLHASGVTDLMGNPSLPDSIAFWSTDSLPDQEFRVVSVFPADGQTDANPAGPYTITLNAWVPEERLRELYALTRVTDGERVQGTLRRQDALTFRFTPEQHLSGQMQYRVDLHGGLATLWGDTLPGHRWTFSPAWSTLPGEISGRLSGTARAAVLVLTPAGGEGEPRLEMVEPGDYTLTEVPAGRYTLSAFVDGNGNGRWDPGEPYGAWPGVLEVLPGLVTEGVNIGILP